MFKLQWQGQCQPNAGPVLAFEFYIQMQRYDKIVNQANKTKKYFS